MLANLSVSLIQHKKIRTTLAKAKELRTFIEPLITKSKRAYSNNGNSGLGVHLRREANKFLQDKGAVKILFDEIAAKTIDRQGGYTRVLKMGRRLGDAAELALIELVDYNTEQSKTDTKTDSEAAGEKKSIGKKKKPDTVTTKSKTRKKTTKSVTKESTKEKSDRPKKTKQKAT